LLVLYLDRSSGKLLAIQDFPDLDFFRGLDF